MRDRREEPLTKEATELFGKLVDGHDGVIALASEQITHQRLLQMLDALGQPPLSQIVDDAESHLKWGRQSSVV